MSDMDTNGRTHEPALRELVADLDGLEKLMTVEIRRIDALNTAEATGRKEADGAILRELEQRFADQAVSITKAESAQKQYDESHNALIKDLDKQRDTMMPRSEATARHNEMERRFEAADQRIQALERNTSGWTFRDTERVAGGKNQRDNISSLVAILGSMIGLCAVIVAAIALATR